MKRRFIQCDVFTSVSTRGNGLAVVLDSDGLSDEAMQAFATWTNLAETTFLLPPDDTDADYKVRIFTPAYEMPFAGHPTLGSCAAWLRAGGKPATAGIVRQQCGVGIVEIDVGGAVPAFTAPPTTIEPMPAETLETIAAALAVDPGRILRTAMLNNGSPRPVLELASAEDVLALDSAKVRWPAFQPIGVIGAHPPGGECDYEVRLLAPSSGMSEDPITGSLNAALAHWLQGQGRLSAPIVLAQGTKIGRVGRVYVSAVGNKVLVGGNTQILIEGTLEL
ncbi:phenazine biosynthesis protein PhzF [Labrys miyagiensis]|uniref:Phenazine biosynthesis protein PhzF n=1 Tax=Labrys miyagiensis TaxID=346912 RepID=A0ABQ6CRS9_9HYPH|nr:PhzF family phenazine biosynthesis protein [Labrys miyagiensis]GLS20901.1 phenazine biosynthesis protein PhzF [Labrys miyagiensis]